MIFSWLLIYFLVSVSVLEVLQFGRDAYVAETWLAGQEPLVRGAELGSNVDEVESLIKRHEAFEKLAAGWEERFTLLEKLTTVRRTGGGGGCKWEDGGLAGVGRRHVLGIVRKVGKRLL